MYKTYGNPLLASRELHGLRNTSEYNTWVAIKQRTRNKNNNNYANYGGRGIGMHEEWFNSFTAFYRDVGAKPSPDLTLDRIDNNRGYEPGNVRWTTRIMQARNSRPRRTATKYKYIEKRGNRYIAATYHVATQKRVYVGMFKDEKEAFCIAQDAGLQLNGYNFYHYGTNKFRSYYPKDLT